VNTKFTIDEGSILVTGVGQAGSQMAAAFWVELCRDHQIIPETGRSDAEPTGHWQKLFTAVGTGSEARYVPRCLFLDSDPWAADDLKRAWSELFNAASFVTGVESS